MDLSEIRKEINEIDDKLLELFSARLKCSDKVGEIKLVTNDKVFKPLREKEICEKFADRGDLLSLSMIKNIVRSSRKYQYRMFVDAKRDLDEFESSLSEANKEALCNGGKLNLSLKTDPSFERGLDAKDILAAVSESTLEIEKVRYEDGCVEIVIDVKDDEDNKMQAYVLAYMLYFETIH